MNTMDSTKDLIFLPLINEQLNKGNLYVASLLLRTTLSKNSLNISSDLIESVNLFMRESQGSLYHHLLIKKTLTVFKQQKNIYQWIISTYLSIKAGNNIKYIAKLLIENVDLKNNRNDYKLDPIVPLIILSAHSLDLQTLSLLFNLLATDSLQNINDQDDLKLIARASILLGKHQQALQSYQRLESLQPLEFEDKMDKVICKIALLQIDQAKKELRELLLAEKNRQHFNPYYAVQLGELMTPLELEHNFSNLFNRLETFLKTHPNYHQQKPFVALKIKKLITSNKKIKAAKQALIKAKEFQHRFESNSLDVDSEKKLFKQLIDFFPNEADYKYNLLKLEAISSNNLASQKKLLSEIAHIQPYYFSSVNQ